MTKYFIKKTVLTIIGLILTAVIAYFLINLSVHKPLTLGDKYKTQSELNVALKAAGLDKGIGIRFIDYVKNLVLHGDFGKIYNSDVAATATTIPSLFINALKYTLMITVPVFAVSAVLGISLGLAIAYKEGTKFDSMVKFFMILVVGGPAFTIAALTLLFGDKIGLPTSFVSGSGLFTKTTIMPLILPIIVITLSTFMGYTFRAKAIFVSILRSEQVRIARTKGLGKRGVFKKYILKNSIAPLATLIIPSYIAIVASSIIVETFYNVPGSSKVLVDSIKNADYNVLLFSVIFFIATGLVLSLIADTITILADPRIKAVLAPKSKVVKRINFSHLRKKHSREVEVKNA